MFSSLSSQQSSGYTLAVVNSSVFYGVGTSYDYFQNKIHLIDISIPTSPVVKSTLNLAIGPYNYYMDGFAADPVRKVIYVTERYGGNGFNGEYNQSIRAIDVSNPSSPSILNTYSNVGSASMSRCVLSPDRMTLYVGRQGMLSSFNVSNPSSISLLNSVFLTGWGQYTPYMRISGNTLYAWEGYNNHVASVNISNPSSMTQTYNTIVTEPDPYIGVNGVYDSVTGYDIIGNEGLNDYLYLVSAASNFSWAYRLASTNFRHIQIDSNKRVIMDQSYLHNITDLSFPSRHTHGQSVGNFTGYDSSTGILYSWTGGGSNLFRAHSLNSATSLSLLSSLTVSAAGTSGQEGICGLI